MESVKKINEGLNIQAEQKDQSARAITDSVKEWKKKIMEMKEMNKDLKIQKEHWELSAAILKAQVEYNLYLVKLAEMSGKSGSANFVSNDMNDSNNANNN